MSGAAGPVLQPLWFGTAETPLFGRLHLPAGGEIRGGVVLCPSAGSELAHGDYSLRLLAESLSQSGLAALRFDYAGTGDSGGDQDGTAGVAEWLSNIGQAAELVRQTGAEWVAAAGLRLGATLAAAAAPSSAFDAVALWDPCLSGATFLREQRALFGSRADAGATSEEEAFPGFSFPAAVLEELAGVELQAADLEGRRVYVLADPARPGSRRVRERLGPVEPEWDEYCERLPVLDAADPAFRAPHGVIAQLAAWLGRACAEAGGPTRPAARIAERSSASVCHTPAGGAITERLGTLGPSKLFSITAEPSELDPTRPTIVLLSVAAEPRTGPARQWTELARRWAADGFRVVRFDLSGIGESPARPEAPEHVVYGSSALDDIAEAAAAASPGDPHNVVLVGLCSGAYAAIAAAPRVRPRLVVSINPLLGIGSFDDARQKWERMRDQIEAGAAPEPLTAAGRTSMLVGSPGSRSIVKRVVQWLGARFPGLRWWAIHRLGLMHSPTRPLRPVVAAAVPVLLVCGTQEAAPLIEQTPRELRRLRASGALTLHVVPDLDHSMLHRSRSVVADIITAHLEGAFPKTS